MSNQLPHDGIVPFKGSELSKKEQVASMFDSIAFRYDFINRFLSGGIDIYWRKQAIREMAEGKPQLILDVATGTGDMAIMASKKLATAKFIGIDLSTGMLELGQKKITRLKLNDRITLQQGDSETIEFETGHFDAVMVAFGVRNYEHLHKGLAEMLRVLKPGGKLVVLEFSKPGGLLRGPYNLYMKTIAAGIGNLLAKNKEAYQYLNDSVKAFPEGNRLLEILSEAGFRKTYLKKMTFGICTIYCGSK